MDKLHPVLNILCKNQWKHCWLNRTFLLQKCTIMWNINDSLCLETSYIHYSLQHTTWKVVRIKTCYWRYCRNMWYRSKQSVACIGKLTLLTINVAIMTLILMITAHFTVRFVPIVVVSGRKAAPGHPVWQGSLAWSARWLWLLLLGHIILTEQAINNLLSKPSRIKTLVAIITFVDNISICQSKFSVPSLKWPVLCRVGR